MKRKINYSGTFFTLNALIMWVTGIFEIENLFSCYETVNYGVFVCNHTLRLFIFIITLSIFCMWIGWLIIDLVCLEWEEDNTHN